MAKNNGSVKSTRISVRLEGTRPLMFDRYLGKKDTTFDEKLYLDSDGMLCLPSTAIESFFTSVNSDSATKLVMGRKSKSYMSAFRAHLTVDGGELLQLKKDGKPIHYVPIAKDKDEEPSSGILRKKHTTRVKGGIPQDKERPQLPLPWSLEFHLVLYANDTANVGDVERVLNAGGRGTGLGTFRPQHGQFEVARFETV